MKTACPPVYIMDKVTTTGKMDNVTQEAVSEPKHSKYKSEESKATSKGEDSPCNEKQPKRSKDFQIFLSQINALKFDKYAC